MSFRGHSIQADMSATMWLLVCACLLLFAPGAECSSPGTTLASLIDEHVVLRRDASPYVAYDDVVITRRAKLTIEPGCEIRFAKGKQLHVYGTLDARGTPSMRILFTKLDLEQQQQQQQEQQQEDLTGNTQQESSDNSIYNSDVYMNRRFRLVEGDTVLDGKLQIFVNSKWHYVCSTQFK